MVNGAGGERQKYYIGGSPNKDDTFNVDDSKGKGIHYTTNPKGIPRELQQALSGAGIRPVNPDRETRGGNDTHNLGGTNHKVTAYGGSGSDVANLTGTKTPDAGRYETQDEVFFQNKGSKAKPDTVNVGANYNKDARIWGDKNDTLNLPAGYQQKEDDSPYYDDYQGPNGNTITINNFRDSGPRVNIAPPPRDD